MITITLRCNECRAQFDDAEAIDGERCPTCMGDSLFERITYVAPDLRSTLIEISTTRIWEGA